MSGVDPVRDRACTRLLCPPSEASAAGPRPEEQKPRPGPVGPSPAPEALAARHGICHAGAAGKSALAKSAALCATLPAGLARAVPARKLAPLLDQGREPPNTEARTS